MQTEALQLALNRLAQAVSGIGRAMATPVSLPQPTVVGRAGAAISYSDNNGRAMYRVHQSGVAALTFTLPDVYDQGSIFVVSFVVTVKLAASVKHYPINYFTTNTVIYKTAVVAIGYDGKSLVVDIAGLPLGMVRSGNNPVWLTDPVDIGEGDFPVHFVGSHTMVSFTPVFAQRIK